MGSLMSGWDAQVLDPNTVKYMRNKSLTRDEIEAYWRSKKKTEEDHMNSIFSVSPNSPKKDFIAKPSTTTTTNSYMDELINKNSCWWTRSNSAFLNELPENGEKSEKKYKSQHHVAFAST